MIEHMFLLRKFFEPFPDVLPGMIGFEDREALLNHLRDKEAIAEAY